MMRNEASLLKFAFWLGSAILLVLAADAAYFARERLYGDSGPYLFWLVNHESFQILHLRPASYLTQWLPLLGIKAGASLQLVILLHSLSEWLLVAVSFFVLLLPLKQPRLALAMLLTLAVGSRWNYFNPVSELIVGVPLFFVYLALVLNPLKQRLQRMVLPVLLLVTVFNHPFYSALVPLAISWLWAAGLIKIREAILHGVWALLAIIIHFGLMDSYDAQSMASTVQTHSPFDQLLRFPFVKWMVNGIKFKTGEILMAVVAAAALWQNRQHKALWFFITVALGWSLLVIYKYGDYFPERYEPFERYMLPLALFVSLVFFTAKTNETALKGTAILAALWHLFLLQHYGMKVEKRYDQFMQAIAVAEEWNVPKLAFRAENYYFEPNGHNWTMMNESLLLSSAHNSKATRQVFVYEYFAPGTVDNLEPGQLLYAPDAHWRMKVADLNTRYFHMQEGPLLMANTDSVQSNNDSLFFGRIELHMEVNQESFSGKKPRIPVTITNRNEWPLTSGVQKEDVRLYARWTANDGWVSADVRTPLLADVRKSMTQDMLIPPLGTGRTGAVLEAGLVYNDTLHISLFKEAVLK